MSMQSKQRKQLVVMTAALVGMSLSISGQQPPAQGTPPPAAQAAPPPASATNLGNDANGNPLRRALKTGHVSNYDESKVGTYTLPDPLVLANGKPVRDRQTWLKAASSRDPSPLRDRDLRPDAGEDAIGEVAGGGNRCQGARWRGGDEEARRHRWRRARRAADQGDAVYAGGRDQARAGHPARELWRRRRAATGAQGRGPGLPTDPPVAAEIISRGWGYAMVGYNDIQPDRAGTFTQGVVGLTLAPGQEQPGADEWGTISAWSWGVSRIIDYLETDRAVNAKQIALFGHSRLGKTALWATAKDERIAAAYSSCSGEMGAALARRDWGETLDDMAQNFPWQFAGNLQKYVGRWNEMPVDAHMLIALSAPRPVFISGGTADQWADPVGMFKAAVAAGPVYRLLGKKDLGTTELPAVDTPLVSGDLGWNYHTGGHTATPADWKAFLDFLGKYF